MLCFLCAILLCAGPACPTSSVLTLALLLLCSCSVQVLHALLEKLADNVADYCRFQVRQADCLMCTSNGQQLCVCRMVSSCSPAMGSSFIILALVQQLPYLLHGSEQRL